MRLWSLAPLSLLSASLASAAQVPYFHAPASLPPTTQSITLVDALSNDSDYTLFIRLLQRARLIPTLNKLNGSTLFAPTNDAIKRHSESNVLWQSALADEDEEQAHLLDNIQGKLRQELFYHLLNYSLVALPTTPDPQVHQTLHFPRKALDPPTRDPPPRPPWMPIPGGTLGGKPQRLRVSSRDSAVYVRTDAFGQGGAGIVKGRVDAGNGVLLGIDDVLTVPPDLATVVSSQPSVTYFSRILTPAISSLLRDTPQLTLFLPVDAAWDALHPIERLYLESEYATDDLYRILEMHAVVEKGVKWSDAFEPGVNLTTLDGRNLEVVKTPEETKVSFAKLLQPDIYASNGVLHTVSSLLIPPGSLELTPEKYLLALNCTQFISLLHSVNLTSYINSTSSGPLTILAPRDDVIELFGGDDLPERGSEELRRALEYHFLPGNWSGEWLEDGMLVKTGLREVGLGGGSQVVGVEVSEQKGKGGTRRSVRFGGAGVLGDPIEINNTVIYFVSRPLSPPVDPLQTALPSLDLSSFLAAIFSTSLADTLKTAPSTTLLIPHNSAFKRLGLLVSDHLLSSSGKADLSQVIMHHALDGVVYAKELVNGSQRTYATLEGSDVHMDWYDDGTVAIEPSGGWEGMRTELDQGKMNALTSTGVVHEVSDLLIPRSVNLTVGKLVKAAKGSTMATMVLKAGMDWVLNGTEPPVGEGEVSGAGWTLLCPTDEAFKGWNLTRLYEDRERLRAIVGQHLVPSLGSGSGKDGEEVMDVVNNNRPISLTDSATYSTLLSPSSAYGDIVVREVSSGTGKGPEYVVGIKGARGTNGAADWAKVLSWGRSTTGGARTGGVIQIDRVLVPYQPPWWVEFGAPLGVGAVLFGLICAFFWGVNVYWRRDTAEATYEPVGGFSHTDDEED